MQNPNEMSLSDIIYKILVHNKFLFIIFSLFHFCRPRPASRLSAHDMSDSASESDDVTDPASATKHPGKGEI